MTVNARLVAGSKDRSPEVTDDDVLVVGNKSPSTFYLGATATNNTPVNVVLPKSNKKFIITEIILNGDRSIGANGAITDVYANSVGPIDGTVTEQIIQAEIIKQGDLILTGLHILVKEARWINVKSDDVIVRCNVGGYYENA